MLTHRSKWHQFFENRILVDHPHFDSLVDLGDRNGGWSNRTLEGVVNGALLIQQRFFGRNEYSKSLVAIVAIAISLVYLLLRKIGVRVDRRS